MPSIMRNNIRYGSSIGGGSEDIVELTQEQYDALGDSVLTDNKTYYITDADDQYNASSVIFDNTDTNLNAGTVQDAIVEQNKNLGGLRFGVDGDGNYGYYGADDSLIPFKRQSVIGNLTFTASGQTKQIDVSTIFPNYKNLTVDNFYVKIKSFGETAMYLNDIRGTHNKYSSAPRASQYNPSTGKVTIDSGCIGFGYTGNGAYYQWAKELTVVCVV